MWVSDKHLTGWACSACDWTFPLPSLLSDPEAKKAYDRLASAKFQLHDCAAHRQSAASLDPYGTIRHSSLFVETEFLTLAQAIESFHRLTDKSTVVEPQVFAQVKEDLFGFISQQSWANSAIGDRCKEATNFLNDPTFKTRIQSLLAGIDPERLKTLVGDPVAFEQTLRQTRNYLTHPGTEKKGKVLTDPKELFLFNQKLHVLLRLLMLKTMGFAEEAIFDQMFQQSHRYA